MPEVKSFLLARCETETTRSRGNMEMLNWLRTCRVKLSWPRSYFISGSYKMNTELTSFYKGVTEKQYSLCSISSIIWKRNQTGYTALNQQVESARLWDLQGIFNDTHKSHDIFFSCIWLLLVLPCVSSLIFMFHIKGLWNLTSYIEVPLPT